MASITREKNGRRTIQFVAADGKRRSIRLGKTSQRQAEAVKVRVEHLAAATISGHPPDAETSRWVAGLDTVLADKLAKVGLIVRQERATLESFLNRYMATRIDVKPATVTVWGHTRRNLVEFFGAERALQRITKGDADEWRLSLIGQGLSESTVCKRAGFAKQFFESAVKQQLISSNPFADLKSGAKANPSRYYFVSHDEANKVLEACPDAQWRLIFALSRYGGLRCPSEHLSLRWGDVDWERERINVRSPKTEHHDGKESRLVPLFPELRPYLEQCFELAETGTEFVITRYRDTNSNLRTQLLRIIKRAGLKSWPKLFQNLRSTRETELAEEFPIHVVCQWIGNSQAVAAKHYLQVTDEHFSKAVQNPVQQAHESRRNAPQGEYTAHDKTPVFQGLAAPCRSVQNGKIGPAGLEPATNKL